LPDEETLARVYERTGCLSPIREMLMDRALMQVDGRSFVEKVKGYPVEFLEEVAVQLMEGGAWEGNRERGFLERAAVLFGV
jgi:hypothetical protein